MQRSFPLSPIAVMLLVLAACAGSTEATRVDHENDPYKIVRVNGIGNWDSAAVFSDTELDSILRVGDAVSWRTENAGLLGVQLPVENISGRDRTLKYRVEFKDESGRSYHDTGRKLFVINNGGSYTVEAVCPDKRADRAVFSFFE